MPRIAGQSKMYLVNANMRSGVLGLELENESKLLNGKVIFVADPWLPGLPELAEPPALRHRKKLGRSPRDLEAYRGYWVVSQKAKDVFEAVDEEAFAFARCDFLQDDGSKGPDLWLCKVRIFLDALDIESSLLHESAGPKNSKYYGLYSPCHTVLVRDRVGSHAIFRLQNSPQHTFCDERFKQACKSNDLRKISFDAVKAK